MTCQLSQPWEHPALWMTIPGWPKQPGNAPTSIRLWGSKLLFSVLQGLLSAVWIKVEFSKARLQGLDFCFSSIHPIFQATSCSEAAVATLSPSFLSKIPCHQAFRYFLYGNIILSISIYAILFPLHSSVCNLNIIRVEVYLFLSSILAFLNANSIPFSM